MGLFGKSKRKTNAQAEKTRRLIINEFYADYPEIPYISDDRKTEWIETALLFPKQSIIPKSMMKRYADNLLPGHVYMLYWLKKYTNKKVPSYFEYKYGIDFEKEKAFLYSNGFLDETDKPTPEGESAIKRHSNIIEQHKPAKPGNSIEDISKQILAMRDSFKRNGFKYYTFMSNSSCCEVCAKLNGKHFPIDALEIGVNAPPMHEKCCCSIAAYSDRDEYEAWLNSL